MKYICCRCDLRAETALGHHACEVPTNGEINAAIAVRVPYGRGGWAWDFDACLRDLESRAHLRGYLWTLTQVGVGEYRGTFHYNIDTLAATALDRTPARAFARAWLRLPIESEGAA